MIGMDRNGAAHLAQAFSCHLYTTSPRTLNAEMLTTDCFGYRAGKPWVVPTNCGGSNASISANCAP
jgi:hypothetical protein